MKFNKINYLRNRININGFLSLYHIITINDVNKISVLTRNLINWGNIILKFE